MRSIVLALIAAASACGESAPPGPIDNHAMVACDQIWISNGFTECESACVDATSALGAMGPGCVAHSSIARVDCSKTFVAQGVTGCCATDPPQVLFAECD